ncbi:MAG: FAD-dependent thymidylate synthase, partial [Thiovulaceae bacterium]|nr:FAD-dependent thymidylate synthase [Sulfurimonadaceae bacterium]
MEIEFLEVTSPSDVAVSAARTCYFPGGIVRPEKSTEWDRKEPLLGSIFKAGHHTTLQHTHVTMLISG